MRSRYNAHSAVGAIAALAIAAAVASPAAASPPVPPAAAPRPAAAAANVPFVLGITLRARRILDNRSIALDPDGEMMKGDRVQFTVLTSQPGYLYVAFCSHSHDPRYHELGELGLSVFPRDRGIVLAPDVLTIAPDPRAEIVLDDSPEAEAVYLIISRSELSQTDPALAAAINTHLPAGQTASCSGKLRRALARPARPGAAAAVAPRVARKLPAAGAPARADDPVPEVGMVERGVEIVFNQGTEIGIDPDAYGIVVKRFDLKHVAVPK